MPRLKNLKRERFCEEIIKNKVNATDAYRRAYGKDGHVAEAAGSRLLNQVEVQQRLAELSAPTERKSRVTAQTLLAELERTIADAREDRAHAAVTGSLALMAKITGNLREQIEIGGPGSFAGCETVDAVITKMIEDEGSVGAALEMIERVHNLLLERAGNEANLIIS